MRPRQRRIEMATFGVLMVALIALLYGLSIRRPPVPADHPCAEVPRTPPLAINPTAPVPPEASHFTVTARDLLLPVGDTLPDLRPHRGLDGEPDGFVIAGLPDGQAMGLRDADVLHAFDDTPLTSLAALLAAVQRAPTVDHFALRVTRDDTERCLHYQVR